MNPTIDTYRLTSMEEPSDAVLSQLMKEAAAEAKRTNDEATTRFFEQMQEDAQKISATWQYCEALREECLREKKSLIFETVLSADDKIDYIRRAHEAGFFIRFFFVATNHPSINASRIAKRVMKGGHDVPITKVISRYYKSILNCKRVSSLVDRTYIYDNSIDDQEARLLFRMVDGKVFKQYVKELPNWVYAIIP